jgi:ABC-type antimicrobial peptide transport system permease subunit
VSSVRRHRREFAVLTTLGWVGRQVSIAVVSQAAAIAATAILIGTPLGFFAGRRAWNAIATELGVPSVPSVSWALVALLAAGIATVSLLAALLPAWSARRARPAAFLRAD